MPVAKVSNYILLPRSGPHFPLSASSLCPRIFCLITNEHISEILLFSGVEEIMKWYPDLIKVAKKDGFTPLHIAAASGHTDVVSLLASHVRTCTLFLHYIHVSLLASHVCNFVIAH